MSGFAIAVQLLLAFLPVWIGLALILGLSIAFKRHLGLYGRLMDSPVGVAGLGIVLFWLLTAIFADWIAPFGALDQISGMQNKPPGTPVPGDAGLVFLFGGDN